MIEKGQLVYRYSFIPKRACFCVVDGRSLEDPDGIVVYSIDHQVADVVSESVLQRAYWTFHGPVTDNVFLFAEPRS